MFHLLTGDRIAVLASVSKESMGINLVNQLNALKVCKRLEIVHWFKNIEKFFFKLIFLSIYIFKINFYNKIKIFFKENTNFFKFF